MARIARKHSITSIYHIMLRGNGKMDIFLDDEDRHKFLAIIETKQKVSGYEVFGYCMMGNHVHLLVKTNDESISDSMKRIGISYAYYFNKKYSRVGHVFQDRFRSETVEDERYLLSVLRYIHNNPLKAGITRDPSQYRWSTYRYYLDKGQRNGSFINTQFILDFLSTDTEKAVKIFKEFSQQKDDRRFIDVAEEAPYRVISITGIKDAQNYVRKYLEPLNICMGDLKKRDNTKITNSLISKLKEESNLSIREISELLGVSKSVVGRK